MSTTEHPTLPTVKERFPDAGILVTSFREQTTLLTPPGLLHDLLQFLRDDPRCAYDFLSDVTGIDYLDYPRHHGAPDGRFGVIYNLISTNHNRRLFVKTLINPSRDTSGIEHDPELHLPSVCDLWPGAEWLEREVFDMYGIRFDNHPDLRRLLTWEQYPAHPLRKDYPLRGRGERENYRVVRRDSA